MGFKSWIYRKIFSQTGDHNKEMFAREYTWWTKACSYRSNEQQRLKMRPGVTSDKTKCNCQQIKTGT